MKIPLRRSHRFLGLALVVIYGMSGCATSWKDEGSYYRARQIQVKVRSTPAGNLFLDNKLIGVTPAEALLNCEEKVKRSARSISYWRTEPGISVFLTIITLGLYIPFGMMPVDGETSLEPTGTFKEITYKLRVEAEKRQPWEQAVPCQGQKQMSFDPVLNPIPVSAVGP